MRYEKIHEAVIEAMSEDFLFGALESLANSEEYSHGELLVLGATVGAGFGNPEVARELLLHLSVFGNFSYDEYKAFIVRPDPVTILEAAESDTALGCVLRGIGLGAGFSDKDRGFRAVASLSEVVGVSYSSPGPRAEYRGKVPSWMLDDDDVPEAC